MAKKKGLLLTALAAGAGAAYAYFRDPKNREKAKVWADDMKEKVEETVETIIPSNDEGQEEEKQHEVPEIPPHDPRHSDLVEKAGNPDPYDFRDTEMVGEGAQTGVQYYNRAVEEEAKEDAKSDKKEEK